MPAPETRARAVSLASRLTTGQLLALVSAVPLVVVLAVWLFRVWRRPPNLALPAATHEAETARE